MAQKQQKIYFLKNNGKYVSTKDSADFIRVVEAPDSGSTLYSLSEFYPNGSKKFISKASSITPLVLEGPAMGYYPNGNKRQYGTHKKNQLYGLLYEYYPNGKIYTIKNYGEGNIKTAPLIMTYADSTGKLLADNGDGYFIRFDPAFKYILEEGGIKEGSYNGLWKGESRRLKLSFTEQYDHGKLISGTATDSAGNTHTYTKREITPAYKWGLPAFNKFMSNWLSDSRFTTRRVFHGKIFLSFTINKDGKMQDVKIVNGANLDSDIQDSVIGALQRTANDWNAATLYGMPVSVNFIQPIQRD